MSQALALISAIGIAACFALILSLIGIGASIEDACRNWPEKSADYNWRRITITRNLTLVLGAAFSALITATASLHSADLQRQLSVTADVAKSAQGGVNAARLSIATLRSNIKALARESKDALDEASAENVQANVIAARVARIDIDTQTRLASANASAVKATSLAARSQKSAHRAAEVSLHSADLAQQAAQNASVSQREALAAAVKAHVYRLADQTMSAIQAALAQVSEQASVFIACSPGLEEVCGQLASAFRAAGLDPTVRPGASFYTGGLDADPLMRTANSNVSVGYMIPYAQAARAIARALTEAGLRTGLTPFSATTIKPNIEINFLYVGATP